MLQNNNLFIMLVIFLEGYISIAIEILTIRQVTPFMGNNTLTTSIIIGFFLLALSFGYYKGGQYTKKFLKVLERNIAIVAIILIIGLSYPFTYIIFNIFDNSIYSLILFNIIVVVPMVFFIGQTLPIMTNYFSKKEKTSEISGKALFYSTLGSFSGAMITSAIFMNFFGVNFTLIFTTILALFILIIIKIKNKSKNIFFIIIIITFIFFSRQEFFDITNQYSNIKVFNTEKGRVLSINESLSSFVPMEKNSYFKYIQEMRKIISEFKPNEKKDILVVGAGGFTLSYNLKKNNDTYTYIDIDKDLKVISENKLLKDKINGKFVVSDAKEFLRNTKKKYDIIVLDAYNKKTDIPVHLLTNQFFENVGFKLKKDGLFLANIITNENFETNFARNIHKTIENTFLCRSYNVTKIKKINNNIIYKCVLKNNNFVYTDNLINVFEVILK